MTPAEIDLIIDGFRRGGSMTRSNYHAGERITWSYERESDRFICRTQSLSNEDCYERLSEEEMRSYLTNAQFQWWEDILS